MPFLKYSGFLEEALRGDGEEFGRIGRTVFVEHGCAAEPAIAPQALVLDVEHAGPGHILAALIQ